MVSATWSGALQAFLDSEAEQLVDAPGTETTHWWPVPVLDT